MTAAIRRRRALLGKPVLPQNIGLLLRRSPDRNLLQRFLAEQGHKAVATECEDEVSQWTGISLLLVDELSALRCEGVLQDLKRRRHLLPVLLVARGFSQGAVRFLSMGTVDDILRMPVSKSELASRLGVLCRLVNQSRSALNKFERLFEDASWGVAVVEPVDLRIEAANTAFARMLRETPESLSGRQLRSLVPDPAHDSWDEQLLTLRRRGAHTFESELLSGERVLPVDVDATVRDLGTRLPECQWFSPTTRLLWLRGVNHLQDE